MLKKIISAFVSVVMLFTNAFAVASPPEIISPSAVLMEKETGEILYEKNPHNKLPPASVTKIMTLLLVVEAIESKSIALEQKVKISEYAAGMGGSQVFLSPGEEISVEELLKSTVVSSGNDSAVALAELIAGSESGFVSLMNEKAKTLGMNDTTFKNCTGLDTEGHITSAHDIAIMSRELIKYDLIKKYTTIWMDSIRNGKFQLANTNKLIRSYNGITGLKTGSTSLAKFCYSGTAQRDGMELISAIMAAPTSKDRFSDASALLNFGFSNFSLFKPTELDISEVPVRLGKKASVPIVLGDSASILTEKTNIQKMRTEISLPESLTAPISKGQRLGTLAVYCDEELKSEIPIVASENIEKRGIFDIFVNFVSTILLK